MTRCSHIYVIYNENTGRHYWGQGVDPDNRRSHHFSKLRRNKHDNWDLQKDWNSTENKWAFRFWTLIQVPEHLVDLVEEVLIHATFQDNYNIAIEATAPMRGRKHTEQAKKTMSVRRRQSPTVSPEIRQIQSERQLARDRCTFARGPKGRLSCRTQGPFSASRDKDIHMFATQRALALFLGTKQPTVSRHIKSGRAFDGWILRPVDPVLDVSAEPSTVGEQSASAA